MKYGHLEFNKNGNVLLCHDASPLLVEQEKKEKVMDREEISIEEAEGKDTDSEYLDEHLPECFSRKRFSQHRIYNW